MTVFFLADYMHRSVAQALANAGIEQHKLARPDSDIARRAFLHLCHLYNLPVRPPSDTEGSRHPNASSVHDFVMPQFPALFAAIRSYMLDSGYPDFRMEDLISPQGERLLDQLEHLARFAEFRQALKANMPDKFKEAYRLLDHYNSQKKDLEAEQDRLFTLQRTMDHLKPEYDAKIAQHSAKQKELEKATNFLAEQTEKLAIDREKVDATERLLDGDEQVVNIDYDMYSQLLYVTKDLGRSLEDQLQRMRHELDKTRSERRSAEHDLEALQITSHLLDELDEKLPQLSELAREAAAAKSAFEEASAEDQQQTVRINKLEKEIAEATQANEELAAAIAEAEKEEQRVGEEQQELLQKRADHERAFEIAEQETDAKIKELEALIQQHETEKAKIEAETQHLIELRLTLEPQLIAREQELDKATQEMLALLVKLGETYRPSSQ